MIRIAISIWNDRVAPVFDVSKKILIIDLEETREINRIEKSMPNEHLLLKAEFLSGLDIQYLICGAVSQTYAHILLSTGINVFSHRCGFVKDLLKAFTQQTLDDQCFRMPGCCGGMSRNQSRGGLGRGQCRHRKNNC